jgi:WhiB family redox-sensing transcriptional regulator
MSTLIVATNWRSQAACSTADPDLFFPDPDTPTERIEQAKAVCASCPVVQACLEDAFRRGEPEAICGGLTAEERRRSLRPAGQRLSEGVRRPGRMSARQMAVQHGAFVLTCLVQHHMSVEQVANELGATVGAVYRAYRMLVPASPGETRPNNASVVEKLLATSKERLKTLERRGLSHTEIGVVLGVSQSFISASLSVLRQREIALERLNADGRGDGLARMRQEEIRVRLESGAGLTVDDVIRMAGSEIRRMHGEGTPLRQVARELGLCRETVRRAYEQMTAGTTVVKTLTRNEMEEAA